MKHTSGILLMTLCCISPCAGDELIEFSQTLSMARQASDRFQGSFVSYAGAATPDTPLDYSLDGLTEEYRGRAWIEGANTVVEILRAEPGPGSERGDDVKEVLAVSPDNQFRFSVIGSSLTPYANLRVFDEGAEGTVPTQINEMLLVHLKAISEIAGLPIESALMSPEAKIDLDHGDGNFSVTATNDGENPTSLTFELKLGKQRAFSDTRLEMGPASSQIIVESLVEADRSEKIILPRKVVRKLTGTGYGPGRREVVLIEATDLPEISFPVTTSFFERYGRDYPVLYGTSSETDEYVAAAELDSFNQLARPGPASDRWRKSLVIANLVVLACIALIFLRRRWNRNVK